MFAVKMNEKIGPYLEKLIIKNYLSVRKFCIAYLEKQGYYDPSDLVEIRNMSNRFSQIINGKKSIQIYDLPIVTELLGVSCEELLSCGETKIPLAFRRTNYNIAFSDKEADWLDYINRDDHIAAYADEFGKTVLDYAIEFKNYRFIRFLIDKGYITLVDDEQSTYYSGNFGAKSKIKERDLDHPTLNEEFYDDKLLRTQILSLAIENNDVKALDEFKARLFPIQEDAYILQFESDFEDYYDEEFIKSIALAKDIIFNYFLEEYVTITHYDKHKINWVFPFIEELIICCIKNKNIDRAIKALNVAINHNKVAYEKLHNNYLLLAKKRKDSLYGLNFHDALDMVERNYYVDKNRRFVSLYCRSFNDVEPISFNIVCVDYKVKDKALQTKIEELNKIYDDILNLPKQFIRNN